MAELFLWKNCKLRKKLSFLLTFKYCTSFSSIHILDFDTYLFAKFCVGKCMYVWGKLIRVFFHIFIGKTACFFSKIVRVIHKNLQLCSIETNTPIINRSDGI